MVYISLGLVFSVGLLTQYISVIHVYPVSSKILSECRPKSIKFSSIVVPLKLLTVPKMLYIMTCQFLTEMSDFFRKKAERSQCVLVSL